LSRIAHGATPSPNIWSYPAVYELENQAFDPDGIIDAEIKRLRAWTDATILDIGCGTGFHLPRFADAAATVIGVEPHGDLVTTARRRGAPYPNICVRHGPAQALPVADRSIDIASARFAYFFGPGCEPGLRELDRVMRPGGLAVIVDIDAERSTFGRWFSRSLPTYDVWAVETFFSGRGWRTTRLQSSWRFQSRADFEAVVRIEFAPDQADLILAEHPGIQVDYAVVLRTRHF
jgi:ubiquinone/menaquinone biosynthesis C-methylase UbiE